MKRNKDARIAWVLPTYPTSKRGWMKGLIESIEESIELIASYYPGEHLWNGSIPTFDLARRPLRARLLNKFRTTKHHACVQRQFRKALRSSDCTHLVIHFADEAVKWKDVIQDFEGKVFVFCHGIDVTWDMRRSDAKGELYHQTSYPERVRELATKVVFIANSHTTQKRLEDIGICSSKVRRFSFGCDLGQTFPRSVELPRIDSLDIIQVGRLVDCKAPHLTIRAFAQISKKFTGRLLIVGDGPLAPLCRITAKELDIDHRISFLGDISGASVHQLLRSRAIFTTHTCRGMLTNQEEAFGYSTLEAMSHGLPVACGNSGGVSEIVRNEVNGLLFESGSSSSQAASLHRLIEDGDLRNRLGNTAKRYVRLFRDSQQMRRSLIQALELDV